MLLFEKTKIQADNLKYGQTYSFPIKVTNDSSLPISVSSMTTSCSCTQASISPNPIPANSEGTLTINFNTTKAGVGNMTKTTKVGWNYDGTHYTEVFILKADVSRS